MADRIKGPPREGCPCRTCEKRRRELWLARRIERELHEAQHDLDEQAYITARLERDADKSPPDRRWSFEAESVQLRHRVGRWQ